MIKIPHSMPYLDRQDFQAVTSCFDNNYVGPDKALEDEIVKECRKLIKKSIFKVVPSGSAALLMIYKWLNLSEGDEVVLSSINCWSVYNLILLEKATPVLCDVRNKQDFRPSFESIAAKITPNTKIIIITHMFGALVENAIIAKIRKKYPGICIIEDYASSFGSLPNGAKIGVYSDYVIASFGSTKPATGGIGGLLASNTKLLSDHYDERPANLLAFNVNLSRLNLSLLYSQVKRIKQLQNVKSAVLGYYSRFFELYGNDSYLMQRALTFDKIDKFVARLKDKGVTLDYRQSVQPNLAKELRRSDLSEAFNFKPYFSLPLNISMLNTIREKGLL